MKNKINKLQAIVLAGGAGTRLMPLTTVTPKPLLPVGERLMIEHVLLMLAESGIDEVILSVKENQKNIFQNTLKEPSAYGLKSFDYIVDSEEFNGLPTAIGRAEGKIDGRFVVVCGDVLYEGNLKVAIDDFNNQKFGARVLLFNIDDSAGYGLIRSKDQKVVEYFTKNENRHIPGTIESGTYFFNIDVFAKIKQMEFDSSAESKIKDLLDLYIKEGELQQTTLNCWWSDVGKSLDEYNYVSKKFMKKNV